MIWVPHLWKHPYVQYEFHVAALLSEESVRTLEQRLTRLWSKAWANSWSSLSETMLGWYVQHLTHLYLYLYLYLYLCTHLAYLTYLTYLTYVTYLTYLTYFTCQTYLIRLIHLHGEHPELQENQWKSRDNHLLNISCYDILWIHMTYWWCFWQNPGIHLQLRAPEARNSTWDCLPNCLQIRHITCSFKRKTGAIWPFYDLEGK